MQATRFVFGRFVFDAGRPMLSDTGVPLPIGQRALAVLGVLLAARGQVVTKAALMEAAWPGLVVEESNLSVQVAAVRRALGQAPDGLDWIVTMPRIGYRFAGAVSTQAGDAGPVASDPLPAGGKPAVAVLPFANLGGDAEQEYFADGISEDIIAALSRYRWFFVMGRNSSFAFKGKAIDSREIARTLGVGYLLEGSVRRSGRQVRISAQLVDAASAHQLWADRYDIELGDIFDVQDRIAQQVVGAIEPELLKTEASSVAQRRQVGNLDAWDLVQQGTWLFHRVTRSTHLRARELLRQARELDPLLPEAHVWLARTCAGLSAYGWGEDEPGLLREGVEAALAAVQFDERNPYAHYALAITSAYAGPIERAVRAAEKAIELSPSFALGHLVLGMSRLYGGAAAQAVEPLQHGLRLNPYDPQNFVWLNLLALAHLFGGDAHAARESAVRALKVRPDWRPVLETLACCHAQLGDVDAASACVEQFLPLAPPPGDVIEPLWRNNPQWELELTRLLRKAGASRC